VSPLRNIGQVLPPAHPPSVAERDLDALIEPPLLEAIAALEGRSPLLSGMVRYHLGYADRKLRPIDPRAVDRGKRVRPAVALLAAGAAGGDPAVAAPVAAAIELLHNFTLIHDDIQDESQTRRHRPTVRALWGDKQAINAGDALFAAAHLPLARLPASGIAPALALQLLEAFDRMAIAIVEGQTLDLGFEMRADVTSAEYLNMISGKTAAILRFAARSGALLGGSSEELAERWSAFGLALGLGFQIQDDLLGIWGSAADTGKTAADDIRRRKKSFPILMLRERLRGDNRDDLNRLYTTERVDEAGVAWVLAMLERESVRHDVEREIARFHDQAAVALRESASPGDNPFRDRLLALIDRLATRTG
jgi:geranylgeranyl diphosphate synthase type I